MSDPVPSPKKAAPHVGDERAADWGPAAAIVAVLVGAVASMVGFGSTKTRVGLPNFGVTFRTLRGPTLVAFGASIVVGALVVRATRSSARLGPIIGGRRARQSALRRALPFALACTAATCLASARHVPLTPDGRAAADPRGSGDSITKKPAAGTSGADTGDTGGDGNGSDPGTPASGATKPPKQPGGTTASSTAPGKRPTSTAPRVSTSITDGSPTGTDPTDPAATTAPDTTGDATTTTTEATDSSATTEPSSSTEALKPTPKSSRRTSTLPLLVLAFGGLIAFAVFARRRRPTITNLRPADLQVDDAATGDLSTPLIEATLRRTIAAMPDDPDPRRAIIGAYASMLDGFAAAGHARHLAETPDTYLKRCLASLHIRPEPARDLTHLFSIARFSSHEMTETHRAQALAALADALNSVRDRTPADAVGSR
jgi:Domain of unknown function (DUF4129)